MSAVVHRPDYEREATDQPLNDGSSQEYLIREDLDSDEDCRILLVEDDSAIREDLQSTLSQYGYACDAAADWPSASALLRLKTYDLVLVDQWLGRFDTLTVLSEIRAITPSPIIVMSGRQIEADRTIGLELGADDFLQKPLGGREIVARVRALLRLMARAGAAAKPPKAQGLRHIPGARRVVSGDGTVIAFTSTEYEILALLIANRGLPVDRNTISTSILQRPHRPFDRSVDNLIHSIRMKLSANGADKAISTARARGYIFTGFDNEG